MTPRATLVDELAGEIERRVVAGEIAPGTRLRQERLAEELGVSRTPVREALRRLEARGLVELVPNRGAVVRGPTAREIREAYQVRAELEGLAAELAARWIGDSDLERLREAEHLFGEAAEHALAKRGEDEEWLRANDLFHEAVLAAAGNDRLRRTVDDLHRSFPRSLTWGALRRDTRLLRANVEQHRAIREAIAGGDGALARELMTAHVSAAGELVAAWFERQEA